jgi:ATP-dependent phosphofructokinase / diphosphate-dependent phosphofructokinase
MNKAGNAIIGQSGGPTSVINASLAGVVQTALRCDAITHIYGMRYGIQGFMERNIIDIGKEDASTIEGLRRTPSSALGSCRKKLTDEDLPAILQLLREYNIRYFFLIGGNDTMDTIQRIEAYSRDQGYELWGVGVPKTVDNDLYGTDHTPGYGSAGRYVAMSVKQSGLLARDMKRVDPFVIYQAVGRDAGWLAAAAALAKECAEDPPHLIYTPERSFSRERFITDVRQCYDQYGFCSIVCGEGIHFEDGTPVSASDTKDRFNNIEFGAMGGTSAAMALHRMIAEELDLRGEFQVVESLQMCGMDRASEVDLKEAFAVGARAVDLATAGTSGVMVSIQRKSDLPYSSELTTAALSEVAVKAKPMPPEYLNEAGNFVTQAFIDYARPLIDELPYYVNLANHSAE